MKNLVYYFSGTGNSLTIARQIAEGLEDCVIVPVARAVSKNEFAICAEKVILVYPVYAYESPVMVRKFLKKAEIKCGYFAAVATYGSSAGGALAEIKRLLKRKGVRLDYADKVHCVENYTAFFGVPKSEKLDKLISGQDQKTDIILQNIKAGYKNDVVSFRPLSKVVSTFFRAARPLLSRLYKVNGECSGCALCEKLCPAGAINMKDTKKGTKPGFEFKLCEQCMACLNYCPSAAIQFLRLKKGKNRYHHPKVSCNDIIIKDDK